MINFVELDLNNLVSFTKGLAPIIVVDDDEAQLSLVKVCYDLAGRNNELICLNSGKGLLSYLNSLSEGDELPELVLLDINMPHISGFDVLKQIRKNPAFSKVPPIIMFTSSSSKSEKKLAKDYGANSFFSKPADADDYIKFFSQI